MMKNVWISELKNGDEFNWKITVFIKELMYLVIRDIEVSTRKSWIGFHGQRSI